MLPTEGIKDFFFRYRFFFLILLSGLALVGLGIFFSRVNLSPTKVEVLEATTGAQVKGLELVVEIAGEVENPGVYKLSSGARVEDLLVVSGGISPNADRIWMEKSLNRAAKLVDGQKIYIPAVGSFDSARDAHSEVPSAKNGAQYQSASVNFSGQGSGLVNINSASLKDLDSLPGIGQVYATNIIEHRPYSNIEELLSKSVLKQSVYEKIKGMITVY